MDVLMLQKHLFFRRDYHQGVTSINLKLLKKLVLGQCPFNNLFCKSCSSQESHLYSKTWTKFTSSAL